MASSPHTKSRIGCAPFTYQTALPRTLRNFTLASFPSGCRHGIIIALLSGEYLVEKKASVLGEIFRTFPRYECRLVYSEIVSSGRDRKSTRLNSSHVAISYAVFCLKKKIIRSIHYV